MDSDDFAGLGSKGQYSETPLRLAPERASLVKSPGSSRCAYCGCLLGRMGRPGTRDHVPPKALYPPSRLKRPSPLVTVPSCFPCNNGHADDEQHFRIVLAASGDPPNEPRRELWVTKISSSLRDQPDSVRRFKDFDALLVPDLVHGKERHRIYPGRDERVLRVVRKVVRGLLFHHDILWPLQDDQVEVELVVPSVPDRFWTHATCVEGWHHTERDIMQYAFGHFGEQELNWWWLLRFYEMVNFVAWVAPVPG